MIKDWFKGCANADGLTPNEKKMVLRLAQEYSDRHDGNVEKLDFYNDNVDVSMFDSRVPEELKRVRVAVGACAKSVNMLARRSIVDGFTVSDSKTDILDGLLDSNQFAIQYQMAVPSELIFGCTFWTVSPGDEEIGEPKAVISVHDCLDCVAVWDYRRRRVKYAAVIEDVERNRLGVNEPSLIVLHTDYAVIEISRDVDSSDWQAEHITHAMGQPMCVAMRWNPTKAQPFGHSRVTSVMRSLTIQMMLATYNLMAHDQYCAIPQKWLLGLSDEQYDALAGNEEKMDAKKVLLGTLNEEGGTPSAGMWSSTGVAEHTQVLESIAQRMASESDLPLSAFGVLGSNYTSSDALNASSHDLVIAAEALCRGNREALSLVVKMALCVAQDKPWSELSDDERELTVHFKDPSMLSASQIADAMMKICTTVEGFGGTDVYWERLGFDEDERRRVRAEMRTSQIRNVLDGIFAESAPVEKAI